MIRHGDIWTEEGLVVAIEPGGPKGARVVVETDEQIQESEAARAGFVTERPRYKQVTYYLSAPDFATLLLVETDGCHDVLLARRLPLSAFGGRRV